MKRIFLIGLMAPVLSWASGSEEAALQKIEEIQKALKAMSLQGSPTCDIKNNPGCNFQSFCSAVSSNRTKAYVYDNGQGGRMANYNLLYLQDQLALCQASNGKKVNRGFANETDPFANPHLLVGMSGKKYDEQFKAATENAIKTGEDTKKRIVSILGKKRTSSNAAIIDNMISRIQKVKFALFKPESSEELYEKGCFFPNASFDPMKNSVTLCPQMLGVPEGTLDMVLAHELGHAIDPCVVSLELMKDSNGNELLSLPEDAMGTKVLSGVPMSKNPIGSVVQCLQRPESMDIQRQTNAQRHADLETFLSDMEKEGATEDDSVMRDARRQMRRLQPGEEEDYCPDSEQDPKVSFLREAFADWISSEVVSYKLKETSDSKKAKAVALEAQLMGLQMECAGFKQDQKDSISKQMKAAGCSSTVVDKIFEFDSSKDWDNHQGWDKRVSKILLVQPEMQKALGCEPQKNTVLCK